MSSNHQPDQTTNSKQKATSGEEPGEEAKCIEGEWDVDAGQTLHPVHLQILFSEKSKIFVTVHYIYTLYMCNMAMCQFLPQLIATKKGEGESEVQVKLS